MYRKDKIAVAVDNYKRKYSDDENVKTTTSNDGQSDSETDSEEYRSDEEENKSKVKMGVIESVKPVGNVSNLIEKHQAEGFNMFLNKMKSINNKDRESNNNRMKPFEVMDKNQSNRPPDPFTVTSINQSHDLLRVKNADPSTTEQSSVDWLKSHNLVALKITVEDLISQGHLGDARPDQKTGQAISCLIYDDLVIMDYEYKLHVAIEMYSKRIKWYLQGSRSMFGIVGGSKLGVLLDASDANLGFGRVISLQDNLLHLLDEQLYKKKSINMGLFGTNIKFLWDEQMNLNCGVIEEIKEAFVGLSSMGGCNLLQALKHITRDKSIDQVLLILGTCPNQEANMLLYFVNQLLLGRDLPFHCVSYESQNQDVNRVLKTIAETSHGSYHRYSSTAEEVIYTSDDIELLLQEIERAQEVLAKIVLMRKGQFTNRISPIVDQIADELRHLPQYESLPTPTTFKEPLVFDTPKFQPKSSNEWLLKSGLTAKKLGLFTILNPNSYENKSEYIPSIGRMVTSSVYEKAMIQVEWSDGSKRNVHADLSQLFEYQKVLGEQVKLLEQRINWLATGSRRIFGTIIERKVVFILDLSISNLKYLVHILQSMKILLQQQLISKDKFNIVAFSNTIVSFRPNLVAVNNATLTEAWEWLKTLSCSGSRNVMGALKMVFENPQDTNHNDIAQGIYLFASGVPDQQIEPVIAYLEERVLGSETKVHTVLFNVDDYDTSGTPIPSRYANITKTSEIMRMIAHNTRGRFHWFRETGIIESDDIRILMTEIDLAVEYSRRTQQIIKDFQEKYADSHLKRAAQVKLKNEVELCRRDSPDNMIALLPPRATSLSKARLKYLSNKSEEAMKIPKTLAYKSPVDPMKSVTNSKPFRTPIQSAFYTEDKNSKGVVYKDFPEQGQKPRKGIGKTIIPDKEEWICSRDWMKKYSLKNMGLDLLRLVSGTDCKHEESLVAPLEKYVEAKYCAELFPIVNVKGTRKHMQYTITDLNRFTAEVKKALIRYMTRLEWLIISSKRIFGCITETEVAILLDTSGSMTPHMPELILNLKALIWEQLFKRKISYNIIAFNSQIRRFRERLVVADESNCHSAIGWTEHLVASGNTDTTKALQMAFEDPRIRGIYLLTDGKPDSSTEIVLNTVRDMIAARKSQIFIHTISFNCVDAGANDFLKSLARRSGGRYHRVCHDYDIRMFSQRVIDQSIAQLEHGNNRTSMAADLLSIDPYYPPLPQLEGDDLARIAKEIQLSRFNLSKINYFRELQVQLQKLQEKKRREKEEIRIARLEETIRF